MGEEKKEDKNKKGDEGWRRIIPSLIIAIGVTFIFWGVLPLLHIVNLDVINIFGGSSGILTSLLFGLFVGAAHYAAPSNSKTTWAFIALGIIIIFLIVVGGLQLGVLQGPADAVGGWITTTFGGIGDAFACLNPTSEKCVSNPGNDDGGGGSTDIATVSFSGNRIIGGEIKTRVTISYDNKEDSIARVTPKCFVGETEETMQELAMTLGQPNDGNDFLFPKNKLTRTSSICSGIVPPCNQGTACNQNIFFTLTRGVEILGDSWTMYINQEKDPVSSVNTDQPYHVEVESLNNIFPQGQPSQIQVKLVSKDSREKLQAVNHITLTFPSEISIECPPDSGFTPISSGIELRNKDKAWFEQKFGSNEYVFDCTLTVNTETTEKQQIPVGLKSDYTVESTFGPYLLKEE